MPNCVFCHKNTRTDNKYCSDFWSCCKWQQQRERAYSGRYIPMWFVTRSDRDHFILHEEIPRTMGDTIRCHDVPSPSNTIINFLYNSSPNSRNIWFKLSPVSEINVVYFSGFSSCVLFSIFRGFQLKKSWESASTFQRRFLNADDTQFFQPFEFEGYYLFC